MKNRITQAQAKQALARADREQQLELEKQFYVLTGGMVMVLWNWHIDHENDKWGFQKIMNLAKECGQIWKECAEAGTDASMLEMCEAETKIEVTIDNGRSYHEYPYLDHTKWAGRIPDLQQYIYMLHQERRWMPAMLLACQLIALHRKHKWGYPKLAEYAEKMNRLRYEKPDPKYYKKLCWEQYGIDLRGWLK